MMYNVNLLSAGEVDNIAFWTVKVVHFSGLQTWTDDVYLSDVLVRVFRQSFYLVTSFWHAHFTVYM